MSLAIAHFAFGAAVTTLGVAVVAPGSRFRQTLALLGGGWAMVPDAQQVAPVARESFEQLHDSAWANLFWFHRSFDRLDPDESMYFAAVMLALFGAATLVAEWRHYRAAARADAAYRDTPGAL